MANDVCLIFFTQPPAALSLCDAARCLTESGLTMVADPTALRVSWDDGPELQVTLNLAGSVRVEATEIGDETEFQAGMRACDARFEIAISDLDEALDDMNTLIEVQSALQELTGGYQFNSWNSELTGPYGGA